MTIEEMKQKKRERGYTYAQISELTGVPLGTVQKIFCGETVSPRYDTLLALENLFQVKPVLREEASYQIEKQGIYTVEDYRNLPEERRVELIDGYFYDMAAPTPAHQLIAGEVYRQIANFIQGEGGDCIPFISPIDVQLDCDEKTMVQPDVVALCQKEKLKKWGIYGAPDFVLEVISPSTGRKDCIKKLYKYEKAGVREYWLLDPSQKKLLVYNFEREVCPIICGLEQPVPVGIYQGELEIDFSGVVQWMGDYLSKRNIGL